METIEYIKLYLLSLMDSFSVAPTYVQAGAIVILLFLLIVSLAQFRQHFVKWSLKGGLIGLLFGVIFTLLIEGFLLVGGHTVLTSVFGWKNPPKPFSRVLDIGKKELTDVLGVNSQNQSSGDILDQIQLLEPKEVVKIKSIMCSQ